MDKMAIEGLKALATPSVFVKNVLGVEQYPWQAEITDICCKKGGKAAAVVCNEGGKTSKTVAPTIVAAMQLWPGALVVSTAGVSRQVTDQLVPNLHGLLKEHPSWRCTKNTVTAPNGSRYIGFATDDAGKFEGWHTPDSPMSGRGEELDELAKSWGHKGKLKLDEKSFLLMVLDEAKSIDQGIFDAVERCRPDALLVCSSPGAPMGPFYDCFHSQAAKYKTFVVPYTECPHLLEPGKLAVIEEQIRTLPQDLVDSMIYAKFPTAGDKMVFDMNKVEVAMSGRLDQWGVERRGAVDLSGGGDEQPFYVREGNRIIHERIFRERDSTILARMLLEEFRKWELRPEWIVADNGGIGEAIIDQLGALGWPVGRIDFGGRPKNAKYYRNVRTEMFFELSGRVTAGDVLLNRDGDVKEQFSWQKYKLDEKQKLALRPKEEMPHSPDRADALAMLFYNMPSKRNYLATQKAEGWKLMEGRGSEGGTGWMDEMHMFK